jgi:hypothetical protein
MQEFVSIVNYKYLSKSHNASIKDYRIRFKSSYRSKKHALGFCFVVFRRELVEKHIVQSRAVYEFVHAPVNCSMLLTL